MAGAIVVEPVASTDKSGAEIEVPSGSIHHWRGYVYIPNANVDDLVTAVRDPEARRAHHQQDVLVAPALSRDNDSLRLYLKLQRSAIVTAGGTTPSTSCTTRATRQTVPAAAASRHASRRSRTSANPASTSCPWATTAASCGG